MIKQLGFGLFATVMALSSFSSAARAGTDDLILQNRIDSTTLNWILDKTQIFLANSNLGDDLSGTTTIDQNPQFTFAEISTDPNFVKVQSAVSEFFHVNTDKAVLRLRIPKISYKVHKLTASPNSIQVNDPVLTLDANVSVQGVDIGLTNGIQVDLMIPDPTSGVLKSYLTASLDPTFVSIPQNLPPATFQASMQALRDQILTFKLQGSTLDSLPTYIRTHQKEIIVQNMANQGPLTADQIHVNAVTIQVGPLSRSVSFDEFKPLVQSQLSAFIGKMLVQVGDALKTDIGPLVLNNILSSKLSSDFQITNPDLFTEYQLSQFSEPAKDQSAFSFSAITCTHDDYVKLKEACGSKETYIPARVVSDSDHANAKTEFTNKLESGTSSVGLSISEEFLNRLLKTTIDAELWDSMLKEHHLKLGPKGAFVILNQANNTPDLVLDLDYLGDGSILENLFIHKPLHFPLRFATAITFDNRGGIPYFVVTIKKVLSDSNEIMNGIASLGLSSQLIKGFKGKVSGMVLSLASKMTGKKALETDLPILRNIGLETVSTQVSQYGRLNMYIQQ